MSHVVHPYSHRLGILRDWKSRWFGVSTKKYKEFLKCDILIREFLQKKLRGFYVSAIEMERSEKSLRVILKTSRPGMIIGKGGDGAVRLRNQVLKEISRLKLALPPELKLDIEEVR